MPNYIVIVPLSKGSKSTPMSVLQKPALYLLLTTCLYLHRWTQQLEGTLSWNRRSVVWTGTVTSPDVCRTSSLTWESSATAPTQPSSHSEPDLRKFCHLNLYSHWKPCPYEVLLLLQAAIVSLICYCSKPGNGVSITQTKILRKFRHCLNPDKNLEKVPPLV